MGKVPTGTRSFKWTGWVRSLGVPSTPGTTVGHWGKQQLRRMAVSSAAEVLGPGTSSRASPKPRLTHWMDHAGAGLLSSPSANPKLDSSPSRRPWNEPLWSRRPHVPADQPCRAADRTGLWLQLYEPKPTEGPPSRWRVRGGEERDESRPHRTSQWLQSCNPAAPRSWAWMPRFLKAGRPRALTATVWRRLSAQQVKRGCSRQRALRKPE